MRYSFMCDMRSHTVTLKRSWRNAASLLTTPRLNRWVVRYAPQIGCKARSGKRSVCRSWRMDETCVKVRGQWVYLYRSVAKHGGTVDLMLSTRRDSAATKRFFRQAISSNGVPEKVVIDKSGSNLAGLQWQNTRLNFTRHALTPRARSILLQSISETASEAHSAMVLT